MRCEVFGVRCDAAGEQRVTVEKASHVTPPAQRRRVTLGSVQDQFHGRVEHGMTTKPVAAGN